MLCLFYSIDICIDRVNAVVDNALLALGKMEA